MSMREFIFFCAVFPLITYAGGVSVGSGGDVVYCSPTSGSKLVGNYNLDYLMTLDKTGGSNAVQVTSWKASQDRIQKLLIEKYPALIPSLFSFWKDLSNENDWTQKRIWLASPHGLLDIHDEQMRRSLPKNCGTSSTGGTNLIQTVVRNVQPNIIRYEYDSEILADLIHFPLQYSYMMTHEWLWDLSDDPQIIRWANEFIHSARSEKLTPADFKTSLNNIGIASYYGGFWSVCSRTKILTESLEHLVQKSCDKIEAKDLDAVSAFTVQTNDSSLETNDLNSLKMLINLTLVAPNLTYLPIEYLAPAQRLNFLEIRSVDLSKLDLNFLLSGSKLKLINFDNCTFSKGVPDNFLSFIPVDTTRLIFNNARLRSLPESFFKFAKRKDIRFQFTGCFFSPEEKVRIIQSAKAEGIELDRFTFGDR